MTATLTPTETATDPLVLHFGMIAGKLSDEELMEFFNLNEHLRFEINSEGDLIIMPPTGMKTGNRNFKLTVAFGTWAEKDGTGIGFDSSTMFTLPNGAKRSPDFCWVRNERWAALSEEERDRFSPICPDFVVEPRSPSDSLRPLQKKMEEYIANGAQLGWLLDPLERKVHVYRPGSPAEVLDDPETVSGEPLLKGFTLDVRAIWE